MSFRRLPKLLLLRSDGKGKNWKVNSEGQKKKERKRRYTKEEGEKKTKAKKIMVLKRLSGSEELHQMFSDHDSTLKVPVNVVIKNVPHCNDISRNRFKIL